MGNKTSQNLPAKSKKLRTLPDSKIDWEEIEKEYRYGSKSVNQIAQSQPCPDGYRPLSNHRVARRAKEKGWQRDKSKEVKQLTTNALLTADEDVQERPTGTFDGQAEITQEDIQKAVDKNVGVVLSHRRLSSAHKANIEMQINLMNQSLSHLADMMKCEKEEDRKWAVSAYEDIANKASLTTQRLTSALGGIVQIERMSYNLLQLPPDLDPNHPDNAAKQGNEGWTFMPPPVRNVTEWVDVMQLHMARYRKQTKEGE